MRIFREENPTILYSRDNTPDPPDSTFLKSVPLVNDDEIFNIIAKHVSLTDHQRYLEINFQLSLLIFIFLEIWRFLQCFLLGTSITHPIGKSNLN
jgi:hypothetical protein